MPGLRVIVADSRRADVYDMATPWSALRLARTIDNPAARRIVLVAAPRFLARLKRLLPPSASARLAADVPADLTHAPRKRLQARVRAAAAPPGRIERVRPRA